MNYTSYLVRRLLYMLVTVVAISAAIFVVIQLPPGDAVDAIVAGREAQGDVITEEDERELRSLYGLDRPMVVQYGDWVIRFLTGNMGRSIRGLPVSGLITEPGGERADDAERAGGDRRAGIGRPAGGGGSAHPLREGAADVAQDRSGGDNADTQAVSKRTATGPAAPAPERRAPGASAYGPGVSRTVTETTPETRRHGHPVTPAATNIDARRSPAGHESRTSAEERYFIAS